LLSEPSEDSIGTGIIPICGSARSGKTTLALALMEWASKNTKRKFAFMGLPDQYLEALPKKIRDRSSNPKLSELSKQRDSIVLLDDTATSLSSRDSTTTQGKMISRIAGVISHLGLTVILTTQSMAGVDLSLLRYTEMSPLVKRIDPMALRVERTEWSGELKEAQAELSSYQFDRSLYWSVSDELLCRHPFEEWMTKDILSRPFRYLEQSVLDGMIHGTTARRKKK
jgi:hypothetical protein